MGYQTRWIGCEDAEKGKICYEVYKYDTEETIVIELKKIHYPIWPYSNNVTDKLKIAVEGSRMSVAVIESRDGWNGTGAEVISVVEIDIDGVDVDELLTKIISASDISDVKTAFEHVKSFLKDYVDDMFSYF